MKRHGILCIFLGLVLHGAAQTAAETEAEWNRFALRLLDPACSDQLKKASADSLLSDMDDRLSHKEIFNYAFPTLKNISRIEAPDNTFRIFTFMVQYADGHHDNYGFTQFEDKKNDRIHVAQLTDNKPEFKFAETKNYGKKQWYGAVYYTILPKAIGKKGQYVLLGRDHNNRLTTRKVMEVISFSRIGEPQFGAPVFKTEKRMFNRIVLEYNAKASVSVRFQKDRNWILFDYVAPSSQQYTGQFQYYGPTGEYDAFRIEKSYLQIVRGADARNDSENKGNTTKTPQRGLKPD